MRGAHMKALITGVAGFIGSHLAESCLDRGWAVVGVDSMTTYYSPTAKVRNAEHFRHHPRCQLLEQDILDVDLPSLLTDVDVVFHLAAQAGVRASWGQSFDTYTHLNVTVLQRLLEAARHANLDRFVFASSSSVYGDAETYPTAEDQILRPVSPYGATKALGENLVYLYFRNYGLPTTSVRYFSVYGPRQRPDMAFHRAIESALDAREFVLYGDGGQTRDFTFVSDVVSATIAAAERSMPGTVYNVGGGSRIAMTDALDIIREEMGTLRVRRMPPQQGDARDTAADCSRAARDLGYEPTWDIDSGLRAQIAWHRLLRDNAALARS
jgi:nucleoside-diphosphate-sugar epimerase